MSSPDNAQRLSDRIVTALELALEQKDLATCDHLVQALELSVTRGAGGAHFVEKRDFPPRIDQALEAYYRLKK